MKRRLLVYKIPASDIQYINQWPDIYMGYKLIMYKPNILNLSQFGTSSLVNLLWYITTFGRFSILVLLDKDVVVHYSYITPKVFRFPFMGRRDQQIGPCVTHPDYRGKGIFTNVLKLIPAYYANESDLVWTYTTQDDIAAQKAFAKAGYSFYAFADMSLKTKIVKIIPNQT
ncbi:MAG: GNAT family N-acetyltransferase [Lentimicrobium sp.]